MRLPFVLIEFVGPDSEIALEPLYGVVLRRQSQMLHHERYPVSFSAFSCEILYHSRSVVAFPSIGNESVFHQVQLLSLAYELYSQLIKYLRYLYGSDLLESVHAICCNILGISSSALRIRTERTYALATRSPCSIGNNSIFIP